MVPENITDGIWSPRRNPKPSTTARACLFQLDYLIKQIHAVILEMLKDISTLIIYAHRDNEFVYKNTR